MSRPQLLLVPEFTEVAWTIRSQLEAWADVASYDPPGVGDEPLPPDVDLRLTHERVTKRGLEELDRQGWDRVVVVADGWGIATAARIAHSRPKAVVAMALGHAQVSFRRHGDRPTMSPGVWEAMTQLLRQDHEAFIRHGISQVTGGDIGEEVAEQMLKRFPSDLLVDGWERITDENDRFGELLTEVGCPLLLAKHEGCLMSTEEGFEDAVAAFPQAKAISVPEGPAASPRFAQALHDFCAEIWEPDSASAPGPHEADRA
jgi:pimeloyl-ACP methyl ester carboxylesterase